MDPWMKLMRPKQLQQLIINHEENVPLRGTKGEKDLMPVVRLFNPIGIGTWILSECSNDGLAFGICDVGYPELGYVALCELAELRLAAGLQIEEDLHWTPTKPISKYMEDAKAGRAI